MLQTLTLSHSLPPGAPPCLLQGVVNNKQLFTPNATIEVPARGLFNDVCVVGSWCNWRVSGHGVLWEGRCRYEGVCLCIEPAAAAAATAAAAAAAVAVAAAWQGTPCAMVPPCCGPRCAAWWHKPEHSCSLGLPSLPAGPTHTETSGNPLATLTKPVPLPPPPHTCRAGHSVYGAPWRPVYCGLVPACEWPAARWCRWTGAS
jgi:hypothetical protein